jgi:hypothetical protein
MQVLTLILLVTLLIEAVVDWAKNFVSARFSYQQVVAFIAALIFAAGLNLNFFSLIGLDYRWPVVGVIFTALVLSRGSNYAHNFFDNLSNFVKKQ